MTDDKIEEILAGKYPAKSHTRRVVEYISTKSASNGTDKSPEANTTEDKSSSVIYLESAKTHMNEDNDQEAPFRQRRYFYYLTGCELPDCYLIYDVKKGESTLFIPPVVDEEVVWSGLPLREEEALKIYDIDKVLTSDKLPSIISSLSSSATTIHAISTQISPNVDLSSFSQQNTSLLKEAIEECRVTKDDYEIALTRKANKISELAHIAVLKAVKSAKNERELQALFLQQCIANGCRNQAYSSIVATGTDAATLHYVRNDKDITSRQLNLLLDAGGEYNCYASDITRTFPINGTFTRGSANIYSIVLKMQKESIKLLKAGVLWDDVHASAHKIAIRGLLDLGILKGDAEEIFNARTSVAFFPHGLGHYLGMDTHDSGGHPNYSDKDPMFKYLRVRGKLPAGSIITVEPGIYFCNFIIEPYLENPEQSKYINKNVLDGYWDVGGVRIEDNVLITEDGYTNLTTVPKEIEEMEKIIQG